MTKLLIIRHGNTFGPDETPRRVGCRTDIPLVTSGIEQAKAIGEYLQKEDMIPDYICASALERAQQTACILMHGAEEKDYTIHTDKQFNEIDHGPDENKTEDEITDRIGREALKDWNDFGVVPTGWKVDPREIQKSWVEFANECIESRNGQITCVVSSGGIIRFAPILLEDNKLPDGQTPKVRTGSISLFAWKNGKWICNFWNKKP